MLYNHGSTAIHPFLLLSFQDVFQAPLLLQDSRAATLEPSPVTPPPPPQALHYLASRKAPGPDLPRGERRGPAADRRGGAGSGDTTGTIYIFQALGAVTKARSRCPTARRAEPRIPPSAAHRTHRPHEQSGSHSSSPGAPSRSAGASPHLILEPAAAVAQLALAGGAQSRQSLPAELPRLHGDASRRARQRADPPPALPLPVAAGRFPPRAARAMRAAAAPWRAGGALPLPAASSPQVRVPTEAPPAGLRRGTAQGREPRAAFPLIFVHSRGGAPGGRARGSHPGVQGRERLKGRGWSAAACTNSPARGCFSKIRATGPYTQHNKEEIPNATN